MTPRASRLYYRGSNPGDARRIATGDREWDSYLFATATPEGACWYGRHVEEIALRPEAPVLREGSREFRRFAGPVRRESMLVWASRIARAAKRAGFVAVEFARQTDIGTPILDQSAIVSRREIGVCTGPGRWQR